jgi:flagellar motor switch protein FliN/FliY
MSQSTNLSILLDVPVEVSVQLGSCHLPMREVLNLTNGSIVQLDKVADAPVDLHVNTKLVARGEVVVVENRFGIKITELLTAL